jgi:hypothetical protein
MAGPWGDVLRLGSSPVAKNEWHTIVQRIRLNTGEEANGILQVWLDGSLELDRRDIKFRRGEMGLIEALCLSTFHGGSDPAVYAPLTTGHALFDDFDVTPHPPANVSAPPA